MYDTGPLEKIPRRKKIAGRIPPTAEIERSGIKLKLDSLRSGEERIPIAREVGCERRRY
jgi:hypothetical protein